MLPGNYWPVADRLERRSVLVPWTGCRIWLGAVNKVTGYGVMGVNGGLQSTHRAAWEDACGPVPDGLCVLHHCDVRCCINVTHLFLGTRADNRKDCVNKDRDCKGVAHFNAKLAEDQVLAIRRDNRSGSQIASEYGINQRHVNAIKARKWWRHV